MNYSQGISTVVVAIIVAFLAVGGVAAVQYQKKQQPAPTEAALDPAVVRTINTARVEAVNELTRLRANLEVGAAVDVSAARAFLTSVRRSLTEAYASAGVTAEAELAALNAQINALQAQLEAGSITALDAVTDLIAVLDVQIDSTDSEPFMTSAESAAYIEAANTLTASGESQADAESDMSEEANESDSDQSVDVQSEAEVEATGNTGAASGLLEASLDADAGISVQ